MADADDHHCDPFANMYLQENPTNVEIPVNTGNFKSLLLKISLKY